MIEGEILRDADILEQLGQSEVRWYAREDSNL